MQYITSEAEMQVQVTVSIQSPLNLILGPVSGEFIVSLSTGGTALGIFCSLLDVWSHHRHCLVYVSQIPCFNRKG